MRSKTDFYRLFFEQLARKGFDVKRSQSSDYIADIYYKNQLVAYFSKADTVIQNPFVAVKDIFPVLFCLVYSVLFFLLFWESLMLAQIASKAK